MANFPDTEDFSKVMTVILEVAGHSSPEMAARLAAHSLFYWQTSTYATIYDPVKTSYAALVVYGRVAADGSTSVPQRGAAVVLPAEVVRMRKIEVDVNILSGDVIYQFGAHRDAENLARLFFETGTYWYDSAQRDGATGTWTRTRRAVFSQIFCESSTLVKLDGTREISGVAVVPVHLLGPLDGHKALAIYAEDACRFCTCVACPAVKTDAVM